MPAVLKKISLPRQLRDAIYASARAAWPSECCGLLIGAGGETVAVSEIVAAQNIAPAPDRRFLIDPQLQFDTLRRLRGSESRLVGHYHSHPNGERGPSRHDIAMADDPHAIWIIAAIGEDRQPSLAAYVVDRPSGVVLTLELEIST